MSKNSLSDHALSHDDKSHVRSQLFVPGNRPERFEKACRSDADLVCIDLEDAVSDQDKTKARRDTLEWLSKTPHSHVSVRINALDTPYAQDDIRDIVKSGLNLPFVMVPKVNCKTDVETLSGLLPERLGPFFTIIETAQGLLSSLEIFSHPRVQFGMFGAIDFAADIDSNLSWDAHLYSRSHLITCAAVHDVTLFDSPHFDVKNLADCEATTRKAKAIGMHARSAIHPAQIAPIHKVLMPTQAEIIEAKRIIEAYDNANGNVVLLDGKFVEKPVIKKAYRVLALDKS